MFWFQTRQKYSRIIRALEDEVKEVRREKEKIVLEAIQNKKTVEDLNKSIKDLQHKKKLEEEEILHKAKLAGEKRNIELEKAKSELEVKYQKKVTELTELFHKKVEERFSTEMANIKEIYKDIIKRLPDVNMAINKKMR